MGGIFGSHEEPTTRDVVVRWGSERMRMMQPVRVHRQRTWKDLESIWRDVFQKNKGQYDICLQPGVSKSIRKVVHVDLELQSGHMVFFGKIRNQMRLIHARGAVVGSQGGVGWWRVQGGFGFRVVLVSGWCWVVGFEMNKRTRFVMR